MYGMISIIICSRHESIDSGLKENIENTIGVEFELIIINNSQNKYSIFEAYNLGIKQSKGKYLCFVHDDIFIHTYDWGKIIQSIFEKNSKIGLIGVAGAQVKTKMPSAWWNCPDDKKIISIIQHNKGKIEKLNYGFYDHSVNKDVAVIDGVFMAARRDEKIFFNAKLKGFHNYDLNISLEYITNNYNVVVTNQILIEHFSIGTLNKDWVQSTLEIHDIYKKKLPVITNDLMTGERLRILEFSNGSEFINKYLNLARRKSISIWLRLIFLNPSSSFHYKFLKKIIKLALRKQPAL